MKIITVTKKADWVDHKQEFLQSWEYGDFLISLGRDITRISCIDNSSVMSSIQYRTNRTKYGTKIAYIPRTDASQAQLDTLLQHLHTQGYTAAQIEHSESEKEYPTTYRYVPMKNIQTKSTWLLDITKTDDMLMKNMHTKTRYNIRLAVRKGVTISYEKNQSIYEKLNHETVTRNTFVSHSKRYIKNLLQLPNVFQCTAWHQNIPLASGILLRYRSRVVYLLGASSDAQRNLMGPYSMHWEIIKHARSQGDTTYDWWGIAPEVNPAHPHAVTYHGYTYNKNHPIAGVTRFKVGFGGKSYVYPPAREYILQNWKYAVHKGIQKISRQKNLAGHPTV